MKDKDKTTEDLSEDDLALLIALQDEWDELQDILGL